MDQNKKLGIVLDFTENIVSQADLLIEVFDSKATIHSKMEFLMSWMEGFKADLFDHPCLDLIEQLRKDV